MKRSPFSRPEFLLIVATGLWLVPSTGNSGPDMVASFLVFYLCAHFLLWMKYRGKDFW